jgi:hypothetical protein
VSSASIAMSLNISSSASNSPEFVNHNLYFNERQKVKFNFRFKFSETVFVDNIFAYTFTQILLVEIIWVKPQIKTGLFRTSLFSNYFFW